MQSILIKGRARATLRHAIALVVLLGADGCAEMYKRGSLMAPRNEPPATAQKPAIPESPYADPLALPTRPAPATNAAEQQVQAFIERLPKSDADGSTDLATRLSDAPAERSETLTRASRRRERAAAPPSVAPAQPLDSPAPPSDQHAATNAAAQIPAAVVDAGASHGIATGAAPSGAPTAPPKLEALTIRPASDGAVQAVGAEDDAARGVTNVPASTEPGTPGGGRTLDESIEYWRGQVAQRPDDADAQWRLRTLLLAAGREQEAVGATGSLAKDDDGLIVDAVRSLTAVRQAAQAPSGGTDAALAEIETLRTKLRRTAELVIPNMALCSKVSSFGVYEELPAGALLAGSANRAVVYCEIRNFHCEPVGDGRLRTALSSRIELLTPDGRSVWQKEEPEIEDLSRQRREDFFLAKLVTFPATLPAGEYVLKVAITDRLAKKANEAIRPLTIHPAGAVSAQR